MRSNQYWKQNEDKKCRICGEEIQNLTCIELILRMQGNKGRNNNGRGVINNGIMMRKEQKTMRRIVTERKKRTETEEEEIEKRDKKDLNL